MSITLTKKESSKLLVGVMGRIASGKSTVANHIATIYGGYYLRFSDTLRQLALDKKIEPTQENLQKLWMNLRYMPGSEDDILARITCSKLSHELDKDPNDLVVAEGIRMMHDVDELNRFCKEFDYTPIYLFIEASINKRVQRFNERVAGDGKGPVDHFTFVSKIDNHECESEIEKLRVHTTFEVQNNQDISSLYEEIDRIMSVHKYSRPALF